MTKEKMASILSVVASLIIVSVYAPPMVVDPFKNFISQVRDNNVSASVSSKTVATESVLVLPAEGANK